MTRAVPLAITFCVSLAFSLFLTPAVRDFALRREIVDAADSSRKLHTRRIPRLGGVAIVAAFLFAMVVSVIADATLRAAVGRNARGLIVLVGGAAVLGIVGVADDLRDVRPRWKLLAQAAAGAAVYAAGTRVTALALPGLGSVNLGPLALPATVFWIVGVVNAMNFIDGLDGLAGGVALLALATIAVLTASTGKAVTTAILLATAGSVLGFLRYNFHPATIFMGDAGSTFLGYVLAVSSIAVSEKAPAAMALAIPLAVLAVPITDTALAIGRRILRGRSVFSADREHIHHLLIEAGVSHRTAVLILYCVTAIFCGLGLAAAYARARTVAAAALPVCGCAALALWKLGVLRIARGRRLREERRRNRALRFAVKTMAFSLRDAATLAEVLEAVAPLPSVLAANRAAVVVPDAGLRRDFPSENQTGGPVFSAVFPFGTGKVEVQWTDGRNRIDRDEEIALQRICSFVERAMRRISAG